MFATRNGTELVVKLIGPTVKVVDILKKKMK